MKGYRLTAFKTKRKNLLEEKLRELDGRSIKYKTKLVERYYLIYVKN